jgi:hypothetical protein
MNFIFGTLRFSRLNIRSLLNFVILVFFFSILTTSCENDPTIIGIDLLPDEEKLGVFSSDTSTVLVHSVFVDSIKTDETARSMLGSYLDPVFGLNTISFATQVRLSSVTVNFGENPVLDSIVLSLDYTTIPAIAGSPMVAYGDTTTVQTIKVFELDEDLVFDTSYYSNYNVAFKPVALASKDVSFRPTDSIMVDTVLVKSQFRIQLSEEFGNSILNAPTSALDSVSGFMNFMKGLYIKPEPVSTGGAIVFFDLMSAISRLTIYYHNDDEVKRSYTFLINAQCARFMNFDHDYSLGDPSFVAHLNGDTTLGAENFYLQSLAGVETRLSFPYIKDWATDQKIILNEAKLVFYNADTTGGFSPPLELFLFELKEDGSFGLLDEQFEGVAYFGGYYRQSSAEYFFRMTQRIQKIISGDYDNTNYTIGVSGASLMPNRVVLTGYSPGSAAQFDSRIRLKIIYTKIGN